MNLVDNGHERDVLGQHECHYVDNHYSLETIAPRLLEVIRQPGAGGSSLIE